MHVERSCSVLNIAMYATYMVRSLGALKVFGHDHPQTVNLFILTYIGITGPHSSFSLSHQEISSIWRRGKDLVPPLVVAIDDDVGPKSTSV